MKITEHIYNSSRNVMKRSIKYLILGENPNNNIQRLFMRDIKPLIENISPSKDAKKILLWSPLITWPCMFLELTILSKLRLMGHQVSVAVCDGGLPHCEMERANFPRPSCKLCFKNANSKVESYCLKKNKLSTFVSGQEQHNIYQWAQTLNENDLQNFEYQGIDLGAFATRYLTTYYQGFVPLIAEIDTARRILAGDLIATLYAERICGTFNPDIVFMLSGNLCQYYGAFRRLRQLNYHVVTWDEGNQWDDGFYFTHDACAGDLPLHDIWLREMHKPLTSNDIDKLLIYYNNLREGTVNDRHYHPSPEKDREILSCRLNLNGKSRILVAFTNVVWDSNVLTKNVGFKSMMEWVYSLIDWFKFHQDHLLILRAHPGEKRLPIKEYETKESATLPGLLKAAYPDGLPNNIRLIPAEDNTYSYTLGEIADAICVYTSNIGLELALTGRKVWVAGQSLFCSKGFSVDLISPSHLVALLDQEKWDSYLDPDEIDLAQRFAHLWIFRYVTRLPYLRRIKTAYPEVIYQNLNFLFPGKDPSLDSICDKIINKEPFLDIPSSTNAVWRMRGSKEWQHSQK